MFKTLIFTATYNESENVKKLIPLINKSYKNADILIIDDNSPDGTANTIQNLSKKIKNIKLIRRDKKKGLDTAHKLAFKYAKLHKYDFFITMDADLSHQPKEIPKIIRLLKNSPFVIGSRYIKGGSCQMSLPRLMLSLVGNKIIKLVLGISCNEFTTSYRGFNLKLISKFDMKNIKSKGYSFFLESIFQINRYYEIKEIPIQFMNRVSGVSKIPKVEILRTLKNIFILKFFKN